MDRLRETSRFLPVDVMRSKLVSLLLILAVVGPSDSQH